MRTVALVPWRTDEGHRARVWAYCRTWWEPHITIVEGRSPDGPFNRSAAINDAACGAWDVAVVLDADVVANPAQLHRAIEIAAETGRLTLGFDRYVGLNESMTQRVLAGFTGDWEHGRRFRSDSHESSIVAVPRALWDEIGGFDERFQGWGQEDVAFAQSARILGGWLERVHGTVWHLSHPRSEFKRRGTPLYSAAQALGKRYRRCTTIEELREVRPLAPTADVRADLPAQHLEG